jgi:hypothetical protein
LTEIAYSNKSRIIIKPRYPSPYSIRSSSQVTGSRAEGAIQGLQSNGIDSSGFHPESEIMQPGEGGCGVTSGSTPEQLGRRGGTGPDDGINVVGRGLFGPEEVLTTEDESVLVSSQVGEGVERVSLSRLLDCLNKAGRLTFCQVLKGSHQLLPRVLAPTHPPAPQSCVILDKGCADGCKGNIPSRSSQKESGQFGSLSAQHQQRSQKRSRPWGDVNNSPEAKKRTGFT